MTSTRKNHCESIEINLNNSENQLLKNCLDIINDIEDIENFNYCVISLIDIQIAFYKTNMYEWCPIEQQKSFKQIALIPSVVWNEDGTRSLVSMFYKKNSQNDNKKSNLLRNLIRKSVKRIHDGFSLDPDQKILILLAPSPCQWDEKDCIEVLKKFPGTYVLRMLGNKMKKFDHFGWSIITGQNDEQNAWLQWFPDNTIKPVFDDGNHQQIFEFQNELKFEIRTDQDRVVHKKEKIDKSFISNVFPKIAKKDLSNELLSIPVRFYKLSFQLHQTIVDPIDQVEIDRIFLDHQKHSIEEVIVKFLEEKNLSSVALGDGIYIYLYLKSNDYFRIVRSVKNVQEMKTDLTTLRVRDDLMSLPVNFLDYKWYYSKPNQENENSQDKLYYMLGEIGENLQGVTTEDLANELCFYLDEEQDCLKEPNLLFDAQLFRILEKDSRFKKIKINEKINVPEFEVARSKNIARPKVEKKLKKHIVQKKVNEKHSSYYIDDLDLRVRTYNCLKRNGLGNLEKLLKMSCSEVKKIHNLKKKMFDEIMDKISILALSKDDELITESFLYQDWISNNKRNS